MDESGVRSMLAPQNGPIEQMSPPICEGVI
jgi:hypothetical protein